MNVSLTPEMQRFVADKLRSGQYSTAEEVVNGALAVLKAQESQTVADVEELRRMIAVGIEQLDRGEANAWDPDSLKRRVRERAASEKRVG